MPDIAILWFRRDLRLDDNPALVRATAENARVLPLYIHAPNEESPWAPGAAARWWLHASLRALDQGLRERGSRLLIAAGESLEVLEVLARTCARTGATRVYWNRLYEPATRERDTRIKLALRAQGVHCTSHNAQLLREPWEVLNKAGQPYRVYSAFWRQSSPAVTGMDGPVPWPAPATLRPVPDLDTADLAPVGVETLGLLPLIRWDQGLAARWQPGESAALARARCFLTGTPQSAPAAAAHGDPAAPGPAPWLPDHGADALTRYAERRDLPGESGTSSLSPHLHFGEIGPRRLLALIADRHGSAAAPAAEAFVRELGWREFAHHLLYHFPHTPDDPLDPRFARFPWRTAAAEALLRAWQRGHTGVPLVDAGMRELRHTGWMHNRVRMVVASYLTKNLRLPWQRGAAWFWDTLVDADLAANTLGWQWTAGCGADAAPYVRIFNPVRQGERFDPAGRYVRRWCPELARLPAPFIHQPWAAPSAILAAAGVTLGVDYPVPVVDLARSRLEALAAFDTVRTR